MGTRTSFDSGGAILRVLKKARGAGAYIVYERTVLLLALIFCAGAAAILWHLFPSVLQSRSVGRAAGNLDLFPVDYGFAHILWLRGRGSGKGARHRGDARLRDEESSHSDSRDVHHRVRQAYRREKFRHADSALQRLSVSVQERRRAARRLRERELTPASRRVFFSAALLSCAVKFPEIESGAFGFRRAGSRPGRTASPAPRTDR